MLESTLRHADALLTNQADLTSTVLVQTSII